MSDLIFSPDTLVPGVPNNVNDVKTVKTETAAYVNGSGWVDTNRLAGGAVTTSKIADANVTTAKIADANVTSAKIADANVTTAKISDANVTAAKLDSGLSTQIGSNDGTTVRRGKSIIATSETFTQTSYGWATTPDRVQNLVLPTDGLIFLLYEATVSSSASSAGWASIFIGGNALKIESGGTTIASEVQITSTTDNHITSAAPGLFNSGSGVTGYAPVTTGQPVAGSNSRSAGGICAIFAAAGTYDVGIQFKSTSGSVTVKNRKLWVWTQGF